MNSKMPEFVCGLFLLFAVISSVNGDCPSTAAGCIARDSFDKLSQGDPSYYCEEGAKLAAKAQNCLKDCSFSEQDAELQTIKDTINQFCFSRDPACTNVADTFVAQTRCYDLYGGLEEVIRGIMFAFEETKPIECNFLYWGRYCQKTQNCSFNQNLDLYLVKENSIIGLGLAVCGSETLKTLLPYLEQTDGCRADINTEIANKCNISCALADAKDAPTVCSLLESQAKCLGELSAGCTDTARHYVLPRLNTYAVANRFIGCQIKYNGIKVRSAGRECDYEAVINSCLMTHILPNLLQFEHLKDLINRDMPVLDFCSSLENQESTLTTCRINFLACTTPQAKLLTRAEDIYIDKTLQIYPEIGAFPVDNFGMANIYNWLPATCPKGLMWSDRICIATADRIGPATTATIPATTASTPQRVTPSRATPPRTTAEGKGEHPTRGQNDADDFLRNSIASSAEDKGEYSTKSQNDPEAQKSAGATLMPAAALLLSVSALVLGALSV